MIDIYSFGDTPAAITMAKIINERGLKTRKVGRLINRFDRITTEINHVNVDTASFLMQLLYEDSIKKCETFEQPLNTYCQNVISAKYNIWRHRKNIKK